MDGQLSNQRTNRWGQLAVFINPDKVVISRGVREGVKPGSLYCLLSDDLGGDMVGLLRVWQVKEKVAYAKPIWVSKSCPQLRVGWHVFLMGRVVDSNLSGRGDREAGNKYSAKRDVTPSATELLWLLFLSPVLVPLMIFGSLSRRILIWEARNVDESLFEAISWCTGKSVAHRIDIGPWAILFTK